MKETMKAARLHAINDFRSDVVPVPKPQGKELLVKVSACGICGSDIPRIHTLGTSKQKYPLTIGHEFGGEIVAVGPDANPDLVGKVGAIFPCIPCRKCGPCEGGNYAMCEDYDYLGSRSDGAFAEYCLVPSDWHFVESKNPDLDPDVFGMVEPCTVAQHTIRRAKVTAGQNVVIFGAGPIGIMDARWAKIFGASTIMLVDVVDEKVQFARERGVDCIKALTGQEVIAELKKRTGGVLADVVIEGTGTGVALGNCIEVCRTFGTIAMMGNPAHDSTIKLAQHSMILRKELNICGVWNSHYASTPLNEWYYTMEKLDSGEMQVLDLITHRSDVDGMIELCHGIYDHSINICKAMYSAKVQDK